jgi:GNAT superfamily N-acetyltransferase
VTLPEFRGRGLYKATVARRAELARERGYRWLYVDALPTSRPILECLGFVKLTTTTPYVIPAAAAR